MKQVYDTITKQRIEAKTSKELSLKLGVFQESLYRLWNGVYDSIQDRYLSDETKGFILVDIDSGEEFHCATKKTFFALSGYDYDGNTAKYIYEVLKERQKSFSFQERVFIKKGVIPTCHKNNHKSRKSNWIINTDAKQKRNSKLADKLRASLRSAIKRNHAKKLNKFSSLTGASPEFLMGWLENQFTEGMSWENYGREIFNGVKSWHVDHVFPCNTFDLSKEEEQKKCFHYTNLRPLWEKENLSRPRDGRDI